MAHPLVMKDLNPAMKFSTAAQRSVDDAILKAASDYQQGLNHDLYQDGMCGKASLAAEVRVVDPTTGGEKGSKLARFSLIPAEFTWALAEHYGIGARKYDDRNWERGYKWSLSVDALERHLSAWKRGEIFDPETRSHHMIPVAWHACALFIFWLRGLGTNDVHPQ